MRRWKSSNCAKSYLILITYFAKHLFSQKKLGSFQSALLAIENILEKEYSYLNFILWNSSIFARSYLIFINYSFRNHLHSFSRNRFQENGRKKQIWCAVCAILWSTHLDIATNDVLQPPYHQTNTPLLPYSMSIPSKFISFRCTTHSVPRHM